MPDELLSIDQAVGLLTPADTNADQTSTETAVEQAPAGASADNQPAFEETNDRADEGATDLADGDAASDDTGADDADEGDEIAAPDGLDADTLASFKMAPKNVQKALAEAVKAAHDGRSAAEAALVQAQQQTQQVGQRVDAIEAQFRTDATKAANAIQAKFPEIKTPDDAAKLAAENPARYVQFKAEVDAFNENLRIREGQLVAARQEQGKQNEANYRDFLIKEEQRLVERFPAWKDVKVGQREMTEIRDYLVKEGVPTDMAKTVTDANAFHIAHKAMLYDRAQAAKAASVDRTAPKTLKPGTASTKVEVKARERTAALARLDKSGDIEDALALIMN